MLFLLVLLAPTSAVMPQCSAQFLARVRGKAGCLCRTGNILTCISAAGANPVSEFYYYDASNAFNNFSYVTSSYNAYGCMSTPIGYSTTGYARKFADSVCPDVAGFCDPDTGAQCCAVQGCNSCRQFLSCDSAHSRNATKDG